MGYRLHARIPNNYDYGRYIELGKQYHFKWNEFNEKWFYTTDGKGMISAFNIKHFYDELFKINEEIKNEEHDYEFLYNLHILYEMVNYAIEKDLDMYFESY